MELQEIQNEIKAISSKEMFDLVHDYNFYVIEITEAEIGRVHVCLPE